MTLKYFFLIFTVTIVIVRIFLSFYPIHSLKVWDFQPHHYMLGITLIAIYFLIPQFTVLANTILAVGSALVVDEVPLFFIFRTWNWPDDHWKQYHSVESILGILIISVIFYIFLRFIWLPTTLTH